MTLRRLKALHRNQRGVTIVEFGLLAPTFLLFLLGAYDMGHTVYAQAVLQGTLQKVARDASLENSSTASLEADLRAKMQTLHKDAVVTLTPRYFKSYGKAAQAVAETWTDTNGNGMCDAGEPYSDANNNGVWDADGGDSGQGGAKDTVVLTANVSYPRIIPIFNFIGLSPTTKLKAVTVLVNQPYGDQSQYGAATMRNCT